MKAVIRRLHSPDVHDLETFVPDGEAFAFLVQMLVGPQGEAGEESFDIQVCSPQWLIENRPPEGLLLGRHRLIVFEYSYPRLKRYLEKLVARCEGEDWDEVAERLGRFGRWEFEDYRESPS